MACDSPRRRMSIFLKDKIRVYTFVEYLVK